MDIKKTLSYEEFESLARGLVQRSKELGDNWELRNSQAPNHHHHYLVKKATLLHQKPSSSHLPVDLDNELEDLAGDTSELAENEDVASLTTSEHEERKTKNDSTLIYMEYHVVYSSSYQVPSLYFSAAYSSGHALSLDQVWELLSANFVSQGADKWGVATQQEHPYLGRPFYHIHPCHTAAVVGKALQCCHGDTSGNYLVTWLSTFAPVVGLEFSLKYAELQ